MTQINPYLLFNGNCKEAFLFYKSVFGGEFTYESTFGDMPGDTSALAEEDKGKLMHISLPIGDAVELMGSDAMPGKSKADFGNSISLSIHPKSEEEADRIFTTISDGGEIAMPLSKTFWNAYFGMCTDKFGIHWMINYSYEGNGYDVKN